MTKEDVIKMEGIIQEVLPNTTYRVLIENFAQPILASILNPNPDLSDREITLASLGDRLNNLRTQTFRPVYISRICHNDLLSLRFCQPHFSN